MTMDGFSTARLPNEELTQASLEEYKRMYSSAPSATGDPRLLATLPQTLRALQRVLKDKDIDRYNNAIEIVSKGGAFGAVEEAKREIARLEEKALACGASGSVKIQQKRDVNSKKYSGMKT